MTRMYEMVLESLRNRFDAGAGNWQLHRKKVKK